MRQLHVSVVSLGEILKDALAVADKRRRDKLLAWLHDKLPEWFEHRLLPVDAGVCERWAELTAKAGRSLSAADSLIAATAADANLMVATRNVRDFANIKVDVFNPWTFEG